LYDHFDDKARVDDALLKTKVVFITHIHGDHQLGILKMIQERDKLMGDPKNHEFGKMYAVVPPILLDYLNSFVDEYVKHKEFLVFIDSTTINPEKKYFYQ
jgi:ribonuclease BN (tRNA processing enzyme)